MDLWRNMRKQGLKMNTVGYNSILDSQARWLLQSAKQVLAILDFKPLMALLTELRYVWFSFPGSPGKHGGQESGL